MKISTFRISEKYNRERIGEGAIGLILWQWQRSDCLEIYLTVFPKYNVLISLFERFGFQKRGRNLDGEIILIKNRMSIDFSSPYTAFPFIKGHFDYAGYIIIDDNYHDTMFAYSELANVKALETKIESNVINGLSKVYVGKSYSQRYKIGEPVFIYRRYTHGKGKRYHSCITSYCVVTDLYQAKRNNQYLIPFEELKERIGNKSIFNEAELLDQYNNYKNMTVVEMLYYGYFGAGHNVNMDWLGGNGYWSKPNQYPTEVCLTEEQFKRILMEGNINVSNVIID